MLRHIAFASFLILSISVDTKHVRAESANCQAFAEYYDETDKQIAANIAESLANFSLSEPQRLVLELRDLNWHIKQLLLLEQMKGHGCALPSTISHHGYLTNAVECSLKRDIESPECDKKTWERRPMSDK